MASGIIPQTPALAPREKKANDPAFTIDAETVERSLWNLGEALASMPTEGKPRNISELVKTFPLDGKTIQQGKRAGLFDEKLLSAIGIIKPTTAVLKREGVRGIGVDELKSDFSTMIGEWLVHPGDAASRFFPYDVCGLDVSSGLELRRMLVTVACDAAAVLSIGDRVDISHSTGKSRWGAYPCIEILSPKACKFKVSDDEPSSESALKDEEGGAVVSSSEYGSTALFQIDIRYVAPLRPETLIYILRAMGIVTENDVRGEMSWRFRMCQKAPKGFSILEHFEGRYTVKQEKALPAPVSGVRTVSIPERRGWAIDFVAVPEFSIVGKVFVLTDCDKERAAKIIEKGKGIVRTAVSSKTDYVIAGGGLTAKVKKAQEIKRQGGNIFIINERDFFEYSKKALILNGAITSQMK